MYRFDFSGCGESEGDYSKTSLSKLKSDLSKIVDFVMEDLIEWGKRVKPGGIIAGHDYQLQSVKEAVDTYTRIHKIGEWFLTSNHWPSYFWRKG